MNTLLILGDDSASSWLGCKLQSENLQGVHLYIDKSTNLKRVIRLLWRGRLSLNTVLKLFFAEKTRKRKPFNSHGYISSNSDLINIIQKHTPEKILCFRVGLIINRSVLEVGVPIYNVHVSDFPGLGTIARSIKAKKWEQNACLHHIEEGIDTGKVMLKEHYTMLPQNTYKENEDLAYIAGVNLAILFLNNESAEYEL